jgi:hypothetical protein
MGWFGGVGRRGGVSVGIWAPHAPTHLGVRTVSIDANGNQTGVGREGEYDNESKGLRESGRTGITGWGGVNGEVYFK